MEILRFLYDILMTMASLPGVIIVWISVFCVVICDEYIKLRRKQKEELKKERERAERLDKFN